MRSIAIDDFLERVVIAPSGCIEWIGKLTRKGYAEFARPSLRIKLGHRFAWFYFRDEPLRGDLQIDHLCRNVRCVNPYHLEQVTGKENAERAFEARKKSVCPNGHAMEGLNVIARSDNRGSKCRACENSRKREARKNWPSAQKRNQGDAMSDREEYAS